jgi:tetratricopeptide (TPR) repeat protein
MPSKNWWLAIPLTFALVGLAGQTALALGDGGGSSGSSTKQPTCKKGYVYSKKKKRCVRKSSEHLAPSDFTNYGWHLARSGDYLAAIAAFKASGDAKNPEMLNGLGYSHRKLGHLMTGIDYYRKALAIDPDYVLARSYLGEGYVLSGRIDLARIELSEIAQRCGKTCPEYVALLRTIETGTANDW